MAKSGTDSTKVCQHIIIESDNFFVCVKCGVVQNDLIVDSEPYTNITQSKENKTFYNNNAKLTKTLDFLEELKSRNIINDLTLHDTIYYVKKWSTEKIPLPKLHHAYALYYSARKNSLPLSLKEISFYTQIPIKEICKIEKYISNAFDDSPNDYISKFCAILNLTYMDEKIIKSFLEKNYKNNIRSSSHVAIAAIHSNFPSIDLRILSKVSWTAITTIRKISHDLQVGVFH